MEQADLPCFGTGSGTGYWEIYFVEQQLECGPRLDQGVFAVGHGTAIMCTQQRWERSSGSCFCISFLSYLLFVETSFQSFASNCSLGHCSSLHTYNLSPSVLGVFRCCITSHQTLPDHNPKEELFSDFSKVHRALGYQTLSYFFILATFQLNVLQEPLDTIRPSCMESHQKSH